MNRLSNSNKSTDLKDRYYTKNVFGISCVEFTWGLGLPIVIESTFLQLFIKSLGASSLAIGLIPAFFFVGSSVFSLVSSYMTSNLTYKRTAVIGLHIISGVSLLLFGVFLSIFGKASFVLIVFFVSYGIFSLCMGMTLPVWLNYLVDIFSEEKSVSGIAYMLIAQNCAKLIGSMVIVKIVDTYAFSVQSSSLVFIIIGILFTLGSLFFLLTREVPSPKTAADQSASSFWEHTFRSAKHLLNNKNYLRFLAGDFEFFIVVTVISFYANYATLYCDVDPAIAAGGFVGFIYSGAICANFFLGSLGWLSLKQKYLFSKTMSFTAILLLVAFGGLWAFFLCSFLLGAARGTRMVSMAPSIKRLSGLQDSTSYFAISPILTLPFASGLPLLTGRFLDHYQHLGGDAYKMVFAFCASLILVTLVFIAKTDFNLQPLPEGQSQQTH